MVEGYGAGVWHGDKARGQATQSVTSFFANSASILFVYVQLSPFSFNHKLLFLFDTSN